MSEESLGNIVVNSFRGEREVDNKGSVYGSKQEC